MVTDQFGALRRIEGATIADSNLRTRSGYGNWRLGETSSSRQPRGAFAVTPHPTDDWVYTAHTPALTSNPSLVLTGAGGSATSSGTGGPKYYGPSALSNAYPKLTRILQSTVSRNS